MRNFILPLIILILFSNAGFASVTDSGNNQKKEVIVRLKNKVEISDTTVKLKDMGTIIGDNRLMDIEIIEVRGEKESFMINKELVQRKISEFYQKKQEKLPELKIVSDNLIKIFKKSYYISGEKIQSIIEQFLKEHSSKIFSGKKWKIAKILAPNRIKIETEKVDIKVSTADDINLNNIHLLIEFFDEKKSKIKEIRVSAIIDLEEKCWVSKTDIPVGKIITQDDIEYSIKKIKKSENNALSNPSDIIGKQAKRFIRQGEPFIESMLVEPPMINRGDIVDVAATNNNITIITKGKAMEKGYYNKQIRILNLSSNKIFVGIVANYGKVSVNF